MSRPDLRALSIGSSQNALSCLHSDTLGFRNQRGSGLDLTLGATSSLGSSGAASLLLERDRQVTTFGLFASGDLGVGGGAGLQFSLHDDDSVALTSAALSGVGSLAGDTSLGRGANTLNQFVSGDTQGLMGNPDAARYADKVTQVGQVVDQTTAKIADTGSHLKSFGEDAKVGALSSLDENSGTLDIAWAGTQHAAATIASGVGSFLEMGGSIFHRMAGWKSR